MLELLDLSLRHPPDIYASLLPELQTTFRKVGQHLYGQQRPLVILLHGWNSVPLAESGFDLYHCLDPRGCSIYPVHELPRQVERHHYLRPYWKRLPASGHTAIFYHSWYQRVLADRVMEVIPNPVWRRAYREIKQFERQLNDHGTIVLKFWLHIDQEEHTQRIGSTTSEQQWDHPTRWEAAHRAVDETIVKTHSRRSPWTVVPGQDRYYASAYLLHNLLQHIIPTLGLKGKVWRTLPGDEIITPLDSNE